MKKQHCICFIIVSLSIVILYFLYNRFNIQEVMTTSMTDDVQTSEVEVVVNNNQSHNILRDKHITYYKNLNKDQQEKFNEIMITEQEKFNEIMLAEQVKINERKEEHKKKQYELSNKIKNLNNEIIGSNNEIEKQKLQYEANLVEKEMLYENKKQASELNMIEIQKKLEEKLTQEFDTKIENKMLLIKSLEKGKNTALNEVDVFKKLATTRSKENEQLMNNCKQEKEKYVKKQQNTCKKKIRRTFSRVDRHWRKKERYLNKNLDTKYNDLNTKWDTKYNDLNTEWATKYNDLNTEWDTKYDDKPCEPKIKTVTTTLPCPKPKKKKKRRMWSDVNLKYDINQIGISPSGIPIYTYKYKEGLSNINPRVTYQGVIAQDLYSLGLNHALKLEDNGFYSVDYDVIDVEFTPMKI